ncbi:MAG: tyrosine-type recombinase/integrase [Nostoc sp. DedQUE05]|uniref:tyrosine-type recombinase/integrase n=1 Tax=Nostoc sp. DedQUE05 TaxID=3075391 RepID=UPI002AD220F2|nr:tyrosine-type recombinase/integrase [Nostoc sp. DedQUE05]MDZ8096412.1 tyrosine-type recombinase/integrase [Nostoc sp. DedQUE05]
MAITVDPKTQKLNIRFRVNGYQKQFYLASGLNDLVKNRIIVESRWEEIQRDIALGRFDSTLNSYKFGNYQNTAIPTERLSINKLWDKFLAFQTQHLERSTLESDYKQITKIVLELSSQSLEDAPKVRDWLLAKYSYHTAHKALAAFSRCCRWASDSCLIHSNPFEKMQLPSPKSPSNEKKAYTLEERDLIITAFESHPKFSHYSSLIKFLFWTGCRHGEAFALTWGDVSRECTRISISKAYASRVRVVKGTKNNKRRVFACLQGSKLQSLLAGVKPDSPDPKELIFKSTSGERLNLNILDKCWRAHNAGGYRYIGVVTELADQGIVPYLKAYSTRHTFATWAIASGASPEKVAYWIGDNVQTVLRYYCHPDVTKAECPDF